MKTLRLLLILASVNAFGQNDYFFPSGVSFDPVIPTPEQFLGYPVGEWHSRHDRIVSYFQELARLSPKAHFQVIGYTHERRPQIVLTITSAENYARLEEIRVEHLKLSTPGTAVNLTGMPVIVTHGYNVHGNEPSSSEAAMLTAYYLIAAQGPEAERTLREAVIHIDPNYNPDGRDRHSNWANMHKGFPPVADPADREHNEVWPGGRFNHYWFDLNRDWLPLAHPESRNRVAFFHKWLPNVCTDYHEMGTNGTNFFEPTKQFGSENPVVPRPNYDQLNPLFARYFSKALDDIGSLYFSKEVFDNSYPGYGSTYPDIHGGLGLVFEQASSRGHVQQSSTKVVTFAFTIRNHVRTSLATVKAAVENRELLLKHQQEFFKSALDEGRKSPVRAYVFGDSRDRGRTKEFANLLLQHHIETYDLTADVTLGKTRFEKGKAFMVPVDQTQSRLVRSVFEKVIKFHDSIFYDASTWTMALAYGMPHEPSSTTIARGQRLTTDINNLYTVEPDNKPTYAYVIDWAEYYAPAALYALLKEGVFVKTSFRPFTIEVDGGRRTFVAGSLVISLADQDLPPAEVHRIAAAVASSGWVAAHGVATGLTIEGTNLGSGSIRTVVMPKTAMLVGDGVAATEAGFAWFQMDSKLNMPVTKVNTTQFGNFRLNDYNTLIMVSGQYNTLGEAGAARIKSWMQQGGTLILVKTAISWAIQTKIIDEQIKKEDDKKETVRMDFAEASDYQGSRAIGGSIYMSDLDITHPLGFGYTTRSVPVWRNHTIFLEPSKNSVNTVGKMAANPLLSGYVHPANLDKIKNSPSLMVSNVGQGRAILFVDDPNFRGYWYGTSKMFFNAIFFGSQMSAPNFDAEH